MRTLFALTITALLTTTALGLNAVKQTSIPAMQAEPQPIVLASADNDAAATATAETTTDAGVTPEGPILIIDPVPMPAPEQPKAEPEANAQAEANAEAEAKAPAPETAEEVSPPAEPPMPPQANTDDDTPSWTPMTEAEAMAAADAYLKGLKSLRARFQQISPDGMLMSGTAYIKKPGRARFDYDDPSPITIIADGFWVALLDDEAGTQDRYPLNATPLSLLLTDKSKISDVAQLAALEQGEKLLRLHLQSKEEPGLGTLILSFTREPFALTQWTVIDAQGYETRILLSDMEPGAVLNPALFRIETMNDNDPRR